MAEVIAAIAGVVVAVTALPSLAVQAWKLVRARELTLQIDNATAMTMQGKIELQYGSIVTVTVGEVTREFPGGAGSVQLDLPVSAGRCALQSLFFLQRDISD